MNAIPQLTAEITRHALYHLKKDPEIMARAKQIDGIEDEVVAGVEQHRFGEDLFKKLLAMPIVWEIITEMIQETQVDEQDIAAQLVDEAREVARRG